MNKKIICVGGSPSSGTTLVADLLDSVPGIACPPEMYVFSNADAYSFSCDFVEKAKEKHHYEQLAPYLSPRTFVTRGNLDACGITKLQLNEMLSKAASFPEFIELFLTLFEIHRNRTVDVFAEKTPANINCATQFCKSFPNGLYVHVLRNGLDVVGSLNRRGFSLIQAGMVWAYQVQEGLPARSFNNYIEVKYEDITNDPFSTIARLVKRVNINTSASEIQERYELNSYRRGLARVKSWSVSTFGGKVEKANKRSSQLTPQQTALLFGLGMEKKNSPTPPLKSFRTIMKLAGYINHHTIPTLSLKLTKKYWMEEIVKMKQSKRVGLTKSGLCPYLIKRRLNRLLGIFK